MTARLFFALGLALCLVTTATATADYADSTLDSGVLNDTTPFTSSILVAPSEIITDVVVDVNINHTWVGDITLTLTHDDTGTVVELIPSAFDDSTNLGFDAAGDDVLTSANYAFSDAGTETIEDAVSGALTNTDELAPGVYLAATSLIAAFAGEDIAGTWTLAASDSAGGDAGSVDGWGISFTSTAIPEPGSLTLLGLFGIACVARRRR